MNHRFCWKWVVRLFRTLAGSWNYPVSVCGIVELGGKIVEMWNCIPPSEPPSYRRWQMTWLSFRLHTIRGGLALFLGWGGVMALKVPVERGLALNGCGYLQTFQNYEGARVTIVAESPVPIHPWTQFCGSSLKNNCTHVEESFSSMFSFSLRKTALKLFFLFLLPLKYWDTQ